MVNIGTKKPQTCVSGAFGGAAGNCTPVRKFTSYSSTSLDRFQVLVHGLEADQMVAQAANCLSIRRLASPNERPENMTPVNPYLASGTDGVTQLSVSWCERRSLEKALYPRNNIVEGCLKVDLTHTCGLRKQLVKDLSSKLVSPMNAL